MRRASVAKKASSEYKKERSYMELKRTSELQKTTLVVGSVAILFVSEILPRSSRPIPPDCRRIPVLVENVFHDSNYQVRGKGFLIKERVRRKFLVPIVNDHIQRELKYEKLRSVSPMPLEEYLHSTHTKLHSLKPICNCRKGCSTYTCVCRIMGYKCGTDCHPLYYKKNAACKNYK